MDRILKICAALLGLCAIVFGVLAASDTLPATWHRWVALGLALTTALQTGLPRVIGGASASTLITSADEAAKKAAESK